MFPNDDICTSKQAKLAAKRIFQKYQTPKQSDIDKSGVSDLMKDTYKALGMDYNPDKDDVTSFLSVMDDNGDGKISLQDLEKMAVKYLCGDDSMFGNLGIGDPEEQIEGKSKEQKLQNNSQEAKPKSQSNTDETCQEEEISQKLEGFRTIFEEHINQEANGITKSEAGAVLEESYALLGRKNEKPDQKDIALWIKLCDKSGEGTVKWNQYETFVVKLFENPEKANKQ